MSDHISVWSDQNGDLVGRMPFQEWKILILQPWDSASVLFL